MANKEKVSIDWKNVIKLAVILFIITAIASLCLAMTNYVTSDIIAQRSEQANTEARQTVLPDADKFEEVENIEAVAAAAAPNEAGIIKEAYVGYKGNDLAGYTIKTAPSGYGGAVEVLTGVDKDGKITGITILSQSETPGLGARSTEPAFQEQFKGKDAKKEIAVIKSGEASGNQITAITGATITSKAVTTGVNASEKVYEALAKEGGVK